MRPSMPLKTSAMPGYTEYRRRNPDYSLRETGGIDVLLVPDMLIPLTYNPLLFANDVNGIVIGDIVDRQLIPNPDKTAEARRDLVSAAPRIMRMGGDSPELYVKHIRSDDTVEPSLGYSSLEVERLLEPSTDRDYVATFEAALMYLSQRINTTRFGKGRFHNAIKQGLIQYFLSTESSHMQLVGRGTKHGTRSVKRRNMQLFTLADLNDLIESIERT